MRDTHASLIARASEWHSRAAGLCTTLTIETLFVPEHAVVEDAVVAAAWRETDTIVHASVGEIGSKGMRHDCSGTKCFDTHPRFVKTTVTWREVIRFLCVTNNATALDAIVVPAGVASAPVADADTATAVATAPWFVLPTDGSWVPGPWPVQNSAASHIPSGAVPSWHSAYKYVIAALLTVMIIA